MNAILNNPNTKYYVALDLGSESMAACYIGDSPTPRMIDLQQFGKAYIEKKNEEGTDHQIDYRSTLLYDSPDEYKRDKPSQRMKTRIALRSPNPYRELDSEHASLEFVDEWGALTDAYKKSVFNFFPGPHEQLECQLPNPKIPFQAGADYILPTILYQDAGQRTREVKYSPESLVQNLLSQIIRNFILRSKELRRVEWENIKLAVTVPNVYSLTHVKSIERFLKRHSGLPEQNVTMIYESDAVCHYHHLFDEVLRKIKRDVISVQEQDRNRDEIRYHFVTVDVGSGTTDMSMITVRQSFERNGRGLSHFSGRTSHLVSGRVGRSDGGNKLSYLFAEFYDRQLQSVLSDFQPNSPEIRTEFSFTLSSGKYAEQHTQALNKLSELIFEVKSTMGEEYQIGLSTADQIKLLSPLIDAVFDCLLLDWKYRSDLQADFESLATELFHALILPKDFSAGLLAQYRFLQEVSSCLAQDEWKKSLPNGRASGPSLAIEVGNNGQEPLEDFSSLPAEVEVTPVGQQGPANPERVTATSEDYATETLLHEPQLESGRPTAVAMPTHKNGKASHGHLGLWQLLNEYRRSAENWRWLRARLKRYVEKNVTGLLQDLGTMAVQREGLKGGEAAVTNVINPDFTYLLVAGQGSQFKPIRRAILNSVLARSGNVLTLPVEELKNACCKGAVQVIANGIEIENPYELHGKYYLYQKVVTVNTQEVPLRLNDEIRLTPNTPGLKWMVFSPSSCVPDLGDVDGEDGRLAFICQLGDEEAYTFYYDTQEQLVRINDAVVDKLATFGQIDEAIWPKVWPLVLRSRIREA